MISLDDVRAYLETLGPGDTAGEAGNAFECPVARAGKYRYGVRFVVTAEMCYPSGQPLRWYTPSPEIAELIQAVDALRLYGPVTRREVEALLP